MNYEELTDKLRQLTILEGEYDVFGPNDFADYCRDFKNPPGICILPNCNARTKVDRQAKRAECPQCHNYSVISAPRLGDLAYEEEMARFSDGADDDDVKNP